MRLGASLLLLLAGCASQGLPHRQTWELYSIQGEYSYIGCPGQYTETMEIDGHSFFLGCQGDSTND